MRSIQTQELLSDSWEAKNSSERIECLIITDTDPLSGRPRKVPLERYLHPPPGVHYTMRPDRFTYPKQVGYYSFSPMTVCLSAVRFLLEHSVPLHQEKYSLIHSFFWNLHNFKVPWVHENDQSFGQYLDNYLHIGGFIRKIATEKLSSYLNWHMCRGVIVPSEWARQGYAEEGVEMSKIHVIPPPFPIVNDHREHEGNNILFIGRDYVRKGGETVLDVFEKLDDFPDSRLIYVGRVEDERALRRIRANKRIIHYPRPSDSFLKAEVFPISDIFFLPTRADAFVSSIPEAMGRGIPVVASNIPVLRETIEQGVSGYLMDQGDVEQSAIWLARLLEDRDRRRKMGESAQHSIKRHFSRDKLNTTLMQVYENAIA